MDVNSSALHDKRLSNGPSFRRGPGRESSHHMTTLPSHCTTLTIYKDEKGYGMKVSGDNPVYVQSVKEGGAAERAGLHSGDTILKVNGVNVMNLTHTEVVELIKAEAQVILTVQQSPVPLRERSGSTVMPSPNLPRQLSCHQSRDRITAPQPVDNEKLRQFEYQRAHTLKLMLEKEQRYVESLRSKLAKCTDPGTEVKILQDLHGAERRIQALQAQLEQEGMEPPPLPNRSRRPTLSPPPPVRPSPNSSSSSSFVLSPTPPPLPPRQYLLLGPGDQLSPSSSPGANHQMHTHQRTKSSPDNLTPTAHLAEATKRLIAAESMSELPLTKTSKGGVAWEVDRPTSPTTPPGTPPPPYNMGYSAYDDTVYSHIPEEDSPLRPEASLCETGHISSPSKNFNFLNQGSSPQQPIISMEDEDMSDQEMSQMEDHGPFKRWNKLSKHQAHLAVFLNYVISNSDPSSLLFYLVTDLYKEGSAKEMKKWAYEIHSSFLVPGAPLRLNNVDENVAREIDDVLLKESDKEEILRKIFWKARQKAKEELNEQLADFQAKRTAGLGTLFGPKDVELEESIHDKNKEIKIIESILIPKLEPYLEDIERGTVDDRRFTTGAALGTVLSKVFGIRGTHFNSLLERCPTYVSKDKSLKARLIGKTRKVSTRGHHCIAHQYYLVTYCNHCQFIIWGIGPQGYQCSNCGLNIHRHCVTVLEENCPGPMVKKEKGNDRISKLMEKIRPENARRKPSSLNLSTSDRTKRVHEETETNEHEPGEKGGDKSSRGSTRGEKKSDSTRDGEETPQEASEAANNFQEINQHVVKNKPSTTSINRSESYKERIHQKRQLRERRKTSDPNLSKSNNDTDVDAQALSYNTNSGSSSNSSLSTRSLESPSQSLEAVGVGSGGQPAGQQSWGSDMEAEPDPPDWTTSVPEEVFSQLSPNERKRQEVINELFYSERSHVQALKVLDQIFYKPMKEQQVLPQDQINLLFSNLEEILTFHSQFNASMKVKRKEGVVIGDIARLLLDQFDDVNGEAFKKAAATFCAKQQIALETLKERRRKDAKLNSFLSDAEANPYCRRRQLKDIIPTGWQRLTKYPLLFESLAKYTPKEEEEELTGLRVAIDKSKELLNVVDMAVKEAEDEHRLAEIQRRLDKSPFDKTDHPIAQEFKNLDLTKHKLIHEGSLCWRMTNRQKTTELHVLLLADAIILLQKQDEKFLLKFNSLALSPIIKVSTVLVRHNAVDKKALFLVNTSHNGAQIYDLVANSISEKRKWFKHISDAAEAYKQREGKHREKRTEGATSDFESCEPRDTRENEEHIEGCTLSSQRSYPTAESPVPGATSGASGSSTPQPGSPQTLVDKLGPEQPGTPDKTEKPSRTPHPSNSSEPSISEVHVATSTAETTLVDPSEVVISSRDVLTAEPVLTPLEKLKRKDELVRQILYEKQEIVADILHVPREEFENIADLAGEPSIDKDPSELVLAAVNQAHELSLVVNEALRLSEEEAVVATSETTAVGGPRSGRLPGVPVHKISGIASALTSHLTQLLNIMTERDEERERLRRELQRSREQLHALHEKYDHNGPSDPVSIPVSNREEAKSENPPAETTSSPTGEVFVDALTEGEEITHEEKPISAVVDN